jgi:hypothetical protein
MVGIGLNVLALDTENCKWSVNTVINLQAREFSMYMSSCRNDCLLRAYFSGISATSLDHLPYRHHSYASYVVNCDRFAEERYYVFFSPFVKAEYLEHYILGLFTAIII